MSWIKLLAVAGLFVAVLIAIARRHRLDSHPRAGVISLLAFLLVMLVDCGNLICYFHVRNNLAPGQVDEIYFLGMLLVLLAPFFCIVGIYFGARGILQPRWRVAAVLGLALNGLHLAAFVLFMSWIARQ